nr:unnamed protein product [Digitaria exilis]
MQERPLGFTLDILKEDGFGAVDHSYVGGETKGMIWSPIVVVHLCLAAGLASEYPAARREVLSPLSIFTWLLG